MENDAEDLLSCPICFERFEDPRLLHCGHTFCKECLCEYYKKGNRQHIVCPKCRAPTQLPNGLVESLPKDFRIGQFQDVIRQSEDNKKKKQTNCVMCKKINQTVEASRMCTYCKCDYCEACADRHSNVPAFKGHQIITMPTGDMASLRYCGHHEEEMLMFNCRTCEQFVCSVCTTLTHSKCDVQSITEALTDNHDKLNKALVPLLANEETLNTHLRDYNITIHKLNEAHDAIDKQANLLHEQIKKARNKLQRDLAAYENEQMAKLLTSLSADGSMDAHSFKQLCTDMQNLVHSNDPWTVSMQTNHLVSKATNVNQSLDRLKETKSGSDLQCMTFTPTSEASVELGTLDLTKIDAEERKNYPASNTACETLQTTNTCYEGAKLPNPPFCNTAAAPTQIQPPQMAAESNVATTAYEPNMTSNSGFHHFAGPSTYSAAQQHNPPPAFPPPSQLSAFRKSLKRTRSESDVPPWKKVQLNMDWWLPGAGTEPGVQQSLRGICVTLLPPNTDRQQIMETFGIDVIKNIVVKTQPSATTAWILFESPVAHLAVQRFHQTVVLGARVNVQACREETISQEMNSNALPPVSGMVSATQPGSAPPLIDITLSPPHTTQYNQGLLPTTEPAARGGGFFGAMQPAPAPQTFPPRGVPLCAPYSTQPLNLAVPSSQSIFPPGPGFSPPSTNFYPGFSAMSIPSNVQHLNTAVNFSQYSTNPPSATISNPNQITVGPDPSLSTPVLPTSDDRLPIKIKIKRNRGGKTKGHKNVYHIEPAATTAPSTVASHTTDLANNLVSARQTGKQTNQIPADHTSILNDAPEPSVDEL